jgi:hypothetical protein
MNMHADSFAAFFDTSKSTKSGPSICLSNIVVPTRLVGFARILAMES